MSIKSILEAAEDHHAERRPHRRICHGQCRFLTNTDTFFAPPVNTRLRVFDADEIAERILEVCESITDKRGERHVNEHYMVFDWNIVAGKWAAMLESV